MRVAVCRARQFPQKPSAPPSREAWRIQHAAKYCRLRSNNMTRQTTPPMLMEVSTHDVHQTSRKLPHHNTLRSKPAQDLESYRNSPEERDEESARETLDSGCCYATCCRPDNEVHTDTRLREPLREESERKAARACGKKSTTRPKQQISESTSSKFKLDRHSLRLLHEQERGQEHIAWGTFEQATPRAGIVATTASRRRQQVAETRLG